MDIAVEGSKDLHTNVFWPQIRICLALTFLEECLNFCNFHSLVVVSIKHLKDVHNCLIGHLILLEGFDSVHELI